MVLEKAHFYVFFKFLSDIGRGGAELCLRELRLVHTSFLVFKFLSAVPCNLSTYILICFFLLLFLKVLSDVRVIDK